MMNYTRKALNLTKKISFRYTETLPISTSVKNQNASGGISSEQPTSVEWEKAKPYNSIPGPEPIPILGNVWHFLPKIGKYHGLQPHELHIRQNDEYGDIVKLSHMKFRTDLVVCFNPKDIEIVFRNEGPAPLRTFLPSLKYYKLVMRDDIFKGYGGIFTAEGKDWEKARSTINPILMQPRTVKQYTRIMDEVVTDFVENVKILAARDPNSEMPPDFLNELHKWSLESIGYVAFDSRIGVMNLDLDPNSEMQQFINNVLDLFLYMVKIDVEPNLTKYISTPLWKKYVNVLDKITNFVLQQLDKNEKRLKEQSHMEKSVHEMSVLERLLKIDRRYALGTVMDMMVGGIDTTSRTVGAILYYLSTNPEAQSKLREELIQILPEPNTPITADKLEKMPYLRAVIKEGMRLAPIATGAIRKTVMDLVLSGYQIPKGTEVVLVFFPLTRKEKYYKNANKFIPERWLRENMKESYLNPWTYFPFGFGPRSCVGRRLAQLEMQIFLARLIRNYELEWHHPEMKFKTTLMYGIASPLRIRVKEISK